MKYLVILISALALIVPTVATAAPEARHHPTITVAQENVLLRRHIAKQDRVIRSLRATNANLRLRVTVAEAGLPTAIRGVAKRDFLRLVLMPLYEVYPCDTFGSTPTSWTFTFTSC